MTQDKLIHNDGDYEKSEEKFSSDYHHNDETLALMTIGIHNTYGNKIRRKVIG